MVKRSASVPKAGMPAGKSAFTRVATLGAVSGRRSPVVDFFTSVSRSTPSIRSTGSSTLPSLLLIFWPCESRTRPWM